MAHAGPGAGCVQGWGGPLLAALTSFLVAFAAAAVWLLPLLLLLPLCHCCWVGCVFLKVLTRPDQTPRQEELTKEQNRENKMPALPMQAILACTLGSLHCCPQSDLIASNLKAKWPQQQQIASGKKSLHGTQQTPRNHIYQNIAKGKI